MENIGGTWSIIDAFLNQRRQDLSAQQKTLQPLPSQEIPS
jgi:hypothetical protein